MGQNKSNWFCAQIGAREHYAIPRVLHQRGQLAALCTDFWAGDLLRKGLQTCDAGAARSLAARFHPELVDAPVVSWNLRSLFWEAHLRRCNRRDTAGGIYLGYNEVGRRFANCVREQLKQDGRSQPKPIFFAYDTGALEALAWCREQKIPCVVNQMDPGRVEAELVRREEELWPTWKPQPIVVPEVYFQRREQEWALADRVVVNSDFCRAALIQQGVAREKIRVIPLSYEVKNQIASKTKIRKAGDPLRVLFLGQVILRKGIQYLVQAARLLEKENIQFDVVGPCSISAEAMRSAPKNVIFHGRATRDQAAAWYEQSDVFVLPTLSDGFAITQLEAMAHGLPVVTTPCCGEVVTDGVDGFVVPARDAEALSRVFQSYLNDSSLLASHSAAAIVKAGQFGPARLAENLMQLEADLIQ
jgi:glycosyltransferase involved in cell wall biosynthesis